jgi:hypothetical protein
MSREFLGDIRKMHTLATLEELKPDGYRIKPYGRDVYKRYPFQFTNVDIPADYLHNSYLHNSETNF